MIAILFLAGCSPTKHLQEGEYILSHIELKREDKQPSKERLPERDLERYIRQEPAGRFLWTILPEMIYSAESPENKSWWGNLWRSLGSAPTILDTMQTSLSATNMQLYAYSRGYFDARVKYDIKYNDKKRRADATYSLYQGESYKVDSILYDFEDRFLATTIPGSDGDLKVKLGDRLDIVALNDERTRLINWMQDRGYWGFTIDHITFRADTTLGDKRAALTMVVAGNETIDEEGEPTRENNPIYKIGDIYIIPDYDPVEAIADPNYLSDMDTLHLRGLNIISKGESSIRPRILRRTINVQTDDLYSSSETQRLYDNLTRLGYYRSASISFSEAEDDSTEYYISPVDSITRTRVRRLTATIQTTPVTRHNFTTSLEVTANNIYVGIKPTLGYRNRNLFRGAEVWAIDLTGGWDYFFNEPEDPHSYEVGISTSLTIPRFVSPFNIDPRRMITNPRSSFELSANYQNRSVYHRALFSTAWGYSWSYNQMSYIFRPIDISFINVTNLKESFINDIINPFLKNSYKPQFLVGLSFGAVYQSKPGNITISANFESAGNAVYGLKALSGDLANPNLFGVPYAQYVRGEASYIQRISIGGGDDFKLVYRVLGGIGYAYGNSKNSSLPMDRLFYSGGTNSMRGWIVRSLGPGSEPPQYTGGFTNQIGDMRLEANLELRYPIWGAMKGALFFDVGNVWLSGDEEGSFHIDNFYKQLGFNTGLGIRLDFKYIVVRVDYGIRLYEPSDRTSPWRFNLRSNNTALQFGIGYPF